MLRCPDRRAKGLSLCAAGRGQNIAKRRGWLRRQVQRPAPIVSDSRIG